MTARLRTPTLGLLLLSLAACGDSEPLAPTPAGSPPGVEPRPAAPPATTLATAGGSALEPAAATWLEDRFSFRPPLPALPTEGAFDDRLLDDLEVQVCVPDRCGTESVAIFRSGPDAPSGALKLDSGKEEYHVNWNTGQHDLSGSRRYRIRIRVLGLPVGFQDVEVVSSGKELKDLSTGETIGLVDGRTLPVKFTLRRSALVDAWRLARGGAPADEVAAMLESEWGADLPSVVELLALAGYGGGEVAEVLRLRYGQDAAQALGWLQGVGLADDASSAFDALVVGGYASSDVVAALVAAFDLTAAEVAAILAGAGYTAAGIADELVLAFGTSPADVAAILAGLGFSAEEVGDWLLGELASAADPVAEAAILLAGAGYPFDDVAAWVGANTADPAEAAGTLRSAGYGADLVIVYLHVTLELAIQVAIGDLATAGYSDAEVVEAGTSSTDATLAEIGEGVVDAYALEDHRLADLFEAAGAAAEDAVRAVMEVFDLTLVETLEAFRDTGFPVDHLAETALRIIGDVPGAVGKTLEAVRLGLGVTFDRVTDWLRSKALEQTELLEAAGLSGFSAAEIAGFLYDQAGIGADRIMDMAARYGIDAGEMIEAMRSSTTALVDEIAAGAAAAYDLAAAELGGLLQDAGYAAGEVYGAVAGALGLTVETTIAALVGLGMGVEEVAAWALGELEGTTAQAMETLAGILLGAGYAADAVIDVVLGGVDFAADAFTIFNSVGIDLARAVQRALEGGADPGEIFDAVTAVLGDKLEDAVALLEGAGVPAGAVLAWLADRLDEQVDLQLQMATELLLLGGYAAEVVIDAVFGVVGFGVEAFLIFSSVGTDVGMAVVRALEAGADPAGVFDAAVEALGLTLEEAAQLLRGAGIPVDLVGGWLMEQVEGQIDHQVRMAAELLLLAGYAGDAVAGFVLAAVDGSTELATDILRRVGYSAGQVVDFLSRVAGRSKAAIASALEKAGYGALESIRALRTYASVTAVEAAGFLRDLWGVSKEVAASILADASYGLGAIIDALLAAFTWAGDELLNLMLSLGFALEEILAFLGG